jgi:hypothetical protein
MREWARRGTGGLDGAVKDEQMAEGVGFEPTSDLRRCRFSRPVPSTARPPLRLDGQIFIAFLEPARRVRMLAQTFLLGR